MHTILALIFAATVLACAFQRRTNQLLIHPGQDQRWWRRPLLLLAVVMAVLVVVTPEFFALGLIGDTAFFDLLVLLFSLQLQGLFVQARCEMAGFLAKARAWVMTPRLSYLIVLETWTLIAGIASGAVAVWHRITSG